MTRENFHYAGFSEDAEKVRDKAKRYNFSVVEKPFDDFDWNRSDRNDLVIYRENGHVVYSFSAEGYTKSASVRRSLFRGARAVQIKDPTDLKKMGLKRA